MIPAVFAVDGRRILQTIGIADHQMRNRRTGLHQDIEAIAMEMAHGGKRIVESDADFRVQAAELIDPDIRRRADDLHDQVGG